MGHRIAPRHVRVFLSSPGDVADERALALKVIDQLPYDPFLRGKISIEVVAWDKPGADTPLIATLTPQEAINQGLPKPSDCDVVIVLFWTRMGTPLPFPEYQKPDKTRYLSGTEWEYEDAIQAARSTGKPLVIVYRRSEEPVIKLSDPKRAEKIEQWERVQAFFASFINEDGSIRQGYNEYSTPEDFREKFQNHLKSLILLLLEEKARPAPTRPAPIKPIEWPVGKSPFPGLRAFEPADAPVFFGRGKETDELIKKVASNRFVAVVGASGSGKSSLVRAGLIPRLKNNAISSEDRGSKDWHIVSFKPGGTANDPFQSLVDSLVTTFPSLVSSPLEAARLKREFAGELRLNSAALVDVCGQALRDEPRWAEVLLFIDQFEELFAATNKESVQSFIDLLDVAARAERVRIIVTIRADFYHESLKYKVLEELLRTGTFPLGAPSQIALYEMITRPADRAGLMFEDGLPERILSDTGSEPGSLALMAYTLDELYQACFRNKTEQLLHGVYESLGGVQGAIGTRAESAFLDLPGDIAEKEHTLHCLFRALVDVDENGIVTRRRVYMEQATVDEASQQLLAALTNARLLVPSQDENQNPTIEVAHEALLRNWKRLSQWIEGSKDDFRFLRQIRLAVDLWARSGHKAEDLLTGTSLARAEVWLRDSICAESNYVFLTEKEKAFLSASVAEQDRIEAEERARKAREEALERGKQKIKQMFLSLLVIATVAAIGLSIFAWNRSAAARRERDKAQRVAEEAHSLALAASARQSASEGESGLAMALALEANQIDSPPIQAQQTLAEVAYLPGAIGPSFEGHPGSTIESLAISPDGKKVLSGSDDGTLVVWDIRTGQHVVTMDLHMGWISSVAISPDGRTALSGSGDNTVRLWDLASGAELRRFTGHTETVWSVAFSPDGRFAVSGSKDQTIRVWNMATGREVRQFLGSEDFVTGLAFSPDGQILASVAGWNNRDTVVRLWDFATGEPIKTLEGHTEGIKSVAFSSNGKLLVTASFDNSVRVWNVNTGQTLQTFEHQDDATCAGFDQSGQRVLSTSLDQTVRLWDVATGEEIQRFEGQSAGVLSLAVSPSASTAVSGGENGSILLWKLDSGTELRRFNGHTKRIWQVVISPDGEKVLSASGDRTIRLWDLSSGMQLYSFEGHNSGVTSVAFHPNEPLFISGSLDGTIGLWSMETESRLTAFDNHSSPVWCVTFSPDGRTLVSGSDDGFVRLWDVAAGAEVRQFDHHSSPIWSVTFSHDGRTVLSGSDDGLIRLWDIATGAELRQFVGHAGPVRTVAISPDGLSLLSGSDDRTVRLWDIETGKTRFVLTGHTDGVNTVTFSPDGQSALSGAGGDNHDTGLILWDIKTGILLRRIYGHDAGIWSAVFTPDGQMAVSGSFDQTIRLWHILVRLDDLMDWMQTYRTVPALSCEQREQYQVRPYCQS